ESQRDFADGCGSLSRTFIEGLFGVRPDALSGELCISPGFPSAWTRASLKHPDLTFSFERQDAVETFTIEARFSKPVSVRLQTRGLRDRVAGVTVNGAAVEWKCVDDAVGRPAIEIVSKPQARHEIRMEWKGDAPTASPASVSVTRGETLPLSVSPAKI